MIIGVVWLARCSALKRGTEPGFGLHSLDPPRTNQRVQRIESHPGEPIMKTHAKIASTLVAIVVLISVAVISDAPSAAAQDQRERGMKVVGASRSDVSAGRVNDIGLWAVIIGVSRYEFGEQDLDGYHITNLKNAADDAQALYEFFKSPEG